MTIIYGQCNNATRTEIALGTNYKTIREDGKLINFLAILLTVCYGSNDKGLSFKPYKNVMVVKSLNNFSNAKPNDPHGFKEELKMKWYRTNVRITQGRSTPIGLGYLLGD